jgi:hypothetical protein
MDFFPRFEEYTGVVLHGGMTMPSNRTRSHFKVRSLIM